YTSTLATPKWNVAALWSCRWVGRYPISTCAATLPALVLLVSAPQKWTIPRLSFQYLAGLASSTLQPLLSVTLRHTGPPKTSIARKVMPSRLTQVATALRTTPTWPPGSTVTWAFTLSLVQTVYCCSEGG